MYRDPGSFRDPAGYVVHLNGKVYRAVSQYGANNYGNVSKTGLLSELVEKDLLISFRETDLNSLTCDLDKSIQYLLELDKLDFISYPYEWPFSVLREAALAHLKIHMMALDKKVTLSDATAFNIQFRGPKPVFIDHLSFRPYKDGELWYGHRQFCDQFLNPLLLSKLCGIPHNAWYRSSMEGISASELNNLVPLHKKISINVIIHVILQSYFQNKYNNEIKPKPINHKLPIETFRNILQQLYKWIEKLEVPASKTSIWKDYMNNNVYRTEEALKKKKFISEYINKIAPDVIWDLGCNTGEYSVCCLESGANHVIGFDADSNVLDIAYLNAKKNNLNFLPLYMDFTNPSPSQGWAQKERYGINERGKPDGVLALALLHHLAIGRNIPLHDAIKWIIDIAPTGIIEFVPKNDPMVQKLLYFKGDIFPDYSYENFISIINSRVSVRREETVTKEGRKLIFYERINI